MPAPRKYGKPGEIKKKLEKPPVVVNCTIPRGLYDRMVNACSKEGFMNEQELLRVSANEFLKKGGY